MSEQDPVSQQARKSHRTRERVLKSTVDIIRKEGLLSATPVRIAKCTGFSWGAVQHHFGSKEDLLRAIVSLARDEFLAAIARPDFAGLTLTDQVSMFVDVANEQYRGDTFLAAVEIAFFHRRNNILLTGSMMDNDDRQKAEMTSALQRVFTGFNFPEGVLHEASMHMHCVLTGIAYCEILFGDEMPSLRHLENCKLSVEAILRTGLPR